MAKVLISSHEFGCSEEILTIVAMLSGAKYLISLRHDLMVMQSHPYGFVLSLPEDPRMQRRQGLMLQKATISPC